MGDGFSDGLSDDFMETSGVKMITTSEKQTRDLVLDSMDAVMGYYFFKDLDMLSPGLTAKLGKLNNKLGPAGAVVGALVDAPMQAMFSERDGVYKYNSYTWFSSINIFGQSFRTSHETYQIRNYGDGYIQVWKSSANYLFADLSTPLSLLKDGEYK